MPPVATHAVSQRKGVRKGVERRVRKKVRGVVMQRPVRIKPDLQRHPSAARASSSASLVNRRQSFLMALLSTGSSSAVVVPILAIPMQRISSLVLVATLCIVLELPVKLPNFPTDFPNMENGHPTRSSYKDPHCRVPSKSKQGDHSPMLHSRIPRRVSRRVPQRGESVWKHS